MLHLLVGEDRVRLTDYLMNLICENAAGGREGQIFVVPEQFSHEAERRLCELGGDTISRYAEVLSLSRMADRVASVHGGAAAAYLDRGGRVLAMALAAEQTASRVKLFAAVLRKPEFLAELVQMVEEFQSYCLQPGDLLQAASRAEGQFSQKLEELALLYESYLAVCDTGRADPAERLQVLHTALVDTDWAADRCFYFDGFTDFTGAELAVLQALMRQGQDVWVALTLGDMDLPVFRAARQTMQSIRQLAVRYEVPVKVYPCGKHKKRASDVQTLLDVLFGSAETRYSSLGNLSFRRFDHADEECRHAVHRVKELAAAGVRYRDITIACTDFTTYEPLLRAAMETAGVPGYYAGESDILAKPVLSAVLGALTAASGNLDYQEAALYLKSGLPLLEQDRCDRLDCYAYLWNIRGSQWGKEFTFHPQGFGLPWTPQDEMLLAQLEQDRVTAMEQLLQLRRSLQRAANTGEMVLAVDRFLEQLCLRRRLQEQAQRHMEQGRGQLAQELQQLHEILCDALEQTYLILGTTTRTPDDFVRLFRLLLTQYRVGTIPAGLDQVHVSSLPDLRHRRTGHLLVLERLTAASRHIKLRKAC